MKGITFHFDRKNLKLMLGDKVYDVQPTFVSTDPRIPYWVAEYLETEALKREYAKEKICAE